MNLYNIIKKVYLRIFPVYREVERGIGDSNTLLDVGCGRGTPIKHLSHKIHSVGIDIFEPSLKACKAEKTHNVYHLLNAFDIYNKFGDGSFDCVLAADLIEHFTKEEGLKFMKLAEKVARKRVVILTPNGFVQQEEKHNNPYQIHKSGWNAEEFKGLGYEVIGFNGWKLLDFDTKSKNFRRLLRLLSDISQFIIRLYPNKASKLLCVKKIS